MAKKGDQARASVVATIEEAFKSKGVLEGIMDKKIYVWAQDGPGGEKIQYAISITAPKVPVTCGGAVDSSDGAWSDAPAGTPAANIAANPAATQLSEADKEKVAKLMASLGL